MKKIMGLKVFVPIILVSVVLGGCGDSKSDSEYKINAAKLDTISTLKEKVTLKDFEALKKDADAVAKDLNEQIRLDTVERINTQINAIRKITESDEYATPTLPYYTSTTDAIYSILEDHHGIKDAASLRSMFFDEIYPLPRPVVRMLQSCAKDGKLKLKRFKPLDSYSNTYILDKLVYNGELVTCINNYLNAPTQEDLVFELHDDMFFHTYKYHPQVRRAIDIAKQHKQLTNGDLMKIAAAYNSARFAPSEPVRNAQMAIDTW